MTRPWRPEGERHRAPGRVTWRLPAVMVVALLILPLAADGATLKGCQKACAELAYSTLRAASLAPHDTVRLVEKALLAFVQLGVGRVDDALDTLHDYKARLDTLAAATKPRISPGDHARLTASVDAALACIRLLGDTPPVTNAGPDQTVFVGSTVHLDGSKSSDVDGDPLTYAWSFVSAPPGSAATLADPLSVAPTFVVDLPGTYVVRLVVNDGTLDGAPATVSISTLNSPPVAHTGPDQTVAVGSIVQLDGSRSFDVDGDPLTFRWTVASRPPGSQATLTDPMAEQPAFIADVAGRYVLQLVVTDGLADSQPASVRIDTQNSAPVADPGPDQTVPVGSTVQLDAAGSSDADGDPLTFRWSFATRPAASAAVLSDPTDPHPTFVADVAGTYVVQLLANDGLEDGAPDTVIVTAQLVNQPPSVDAGPDTSVTLPTDRVLLSGSVSDDGLPGGGLAITWSTAIGPGTVTFDAPHAAATAARFPASGTYVLRLAADDGALSSSDQVTVTVNPAPPVNQPPVVSGGAAQTITLPAAASLAGTVSDDGRPDPPGAVTTTWSLVSGPGAVTFGDALAPSTTAGFSVAGSYVLRLTAFDGQLTATADVTVTVSPADPGAAAPPLDPGVITTVQGATEFLYAGPDPIQTGVAPGTIDAGRVAVLRGEVKDGTGAPLTGVRITILDHPQYGQTLTRADGRFDLAVNGGGPLTINYEKAGFLPAQRQVDTPWSDYVLLPDVVLLPLDPQVTVIDLAGSQAVQVARGSVVTDADGTRQATVLVPPGTTAQLLLPGGGTQPLSTLSVRATEYTVGAGGPRAMPAELPPTSAYTYAVELSADEALAAGATEVRFSTPLPFYVENFLGFPVGTIVPLGSYNRARGVWEASDSGRVVRLLGVTGGLADLDVTGDGVADTGAALAALAITDAERQQLVALYASGQSLWRVRIPHFTPWDLNWGIAPPPDAVAASQDPEPDEPLECQSKRRGSIIGCQNGTLGQAVGVAGTSQGVHYQSERTPGNRAAYSLEIPLSGAELPPSLLQIELVISVAGQVHTSSVPAAPNQRTTFTWDGRDGYGRTVQGVQPITVRIGYTYGAVYATTSRFGYNGGGTISGSRARRDVTLWRTWQGKVGGWDSRAAGLGGWTLSVHHTFDPAGQVLHRGDGSHQRVAALGPIITTVAGTGSGFSGGSFTCSSGDGRLATEAVVCPWELASAPDGSLYVAGRAQTGRVRRLASSGIITTVAGTGGTCQPSTAACGDGGPALQAQLSDPWGLAVGPDGSLYVADRQAHRVRRVGLDGIIRTIAGTGSPGFSGDGGPATQAQLNLPVSLAVGPDASVYIAEARRVRRVAPDGIITTVAGTGNQCLSSTAPCGDGGPATSATFLELVSIAAGRDGSLYLADRSLHRLRRVTPHGLIGTIAGTGVSGFSGDGGPAAQAAFRFITAVAVGPDDSVYVVDWLNNRVRWLRPGGVINTLAGSGGTGNVTVPTTGDGGPAAQAGLTNVESGLAVGPDGSVYVSQVQQSFGMVNPRVRRIGASAVGLALQAGLVAAGDGSEVYIFAPSGRHLRTLDALTGAVRREFAYDGDGRLTAVTSGDGNVTTIERDSAGNPTGIVGPFGQRTALMTNADGYLERIARPGGATVRVGYTADGLLTSLTDPRGGTSVYGYDAAGRLIRATDPTGASQTLARAGTNRDYTVTVTSPLGQTTTHRVERLATGDVRLTTGSVAAGSLQTVLRTSGIRTATFPDGTAVSVVLRPDPRWAMQSPVMASLTVQTPGGRVYTRTKQRTATLAEAGNLLSLSSSTETTTVNGLVDTVSYDAATRTITQTSPAARRGRTVLDSRGRVARLEPGDLAPTSYGYDGRGRIETITEGEGTGSRVTRLAYGADGFLASVTDPLGQTATFRYDADGQAVERVLPGGRVARFAYDPSGNVTTITPPGRPDHAFTYTERDQLAAYIAPAVGAESSQTRYTYDADRQPIGIDRPDGRSPGFVYDIAGRLGLVALASGDLSFEYDAAGRLTVLGTAATSLANAYDGSLLTGTTWNDPVPGSVTQTHDDHFRVTSRAVNGAEALASRYDGDGLLTGAGSLTLSRHAQNGLLTGTTLGNVTDALGYNGFGELTSHGAAFGGSTVYDAQYSRDALGRVTQKRETIAGVTDTRDFLYDPAGRLSEVRRNGAVTATYTYDANGNRLTGPGGTTTYTYDAQDRLLDRSVDAGTSSWSYVYTAGGDLLTKTISGQTTAYHYDELGNLVSVTLPTGGRIEYVIDGHNRRIGKRVDGTLVRRYLYADGIKPIAELDANGTVVSRYVYSTDVNVPAYMIKNDATYRLITDDLGSPRLVIDVSTGAVAQRLDYDEFGNVASDTHPGFQPFGFAGGLYDPDARLVRFGARDYDAETGRWTAKDPTGFSGGANLYVYADNDPTNFVDPLGDAPRVGKGGGYNPSNRWGGGFGPRSPAGAGVSSVPGHEYNPLTRAGGWKPGPPPVRTPPTPPPASYNLPPGSGTTTLGASRLAGAARFAGRLSLVLGAFIEGFNLGTWLDERLCISEGFGDALTYGADDHAIEQFIENRERRGRDATFFDLLEFADRCGGGGPMTAYCAGFAP